MRQLMQKALTAFHQLRVGAVDSEQRGRGRKPSENRQHDDWGMSPEDALRVGTVARYK